MNGRNVKRVLGGEGKEVQASVQRCKPCLLHLGRIVKVLILHREFAFTRPGELLSLGRPLCSMWCFEDIMLVLAGRAEPKLEALVWSGGGWPVAPGRFCTGRTFVLLKIHFFFFLLQCNSLCLLVWV